MVVLEFVEENPTENDLSVLFYGTNLNLKIILKTGVVFVFSINFSIAALNVEEGWEFVSIPATIAV